MDSFDKPKFVQATIPANAKVSDLIDADTSSWRVDVVRGAFVESEAKMILGMPLSNRMPPDKRIWRFDPKGNFTVKSAYHLAVKLFSDNDKNTPSTSSVIGYWKKLRQIETLPTLFWALQIAQEHELADLHVQVDSKLLVDCIHGQINPDVYGEVVTDDIRAIATEINCLSFSFIPRSENQKAHFLAHFEHLLGDERVWEDDFPSPIVEDAVS